MAPSNNLLKSLTCCSNGRAEPLTGCIRLQSNEQYSGSGRMFVMEGYEDELSELTSTTKTSSSVTNTYGGLRHNLNQTEIEGRLINNHTGNHASFRCATVFPSQVTVYILLLRIIGVNSTYGKLWNPFHTMLPTKRTYLK
jgi:hypothetical protein